MNEGVALAGCRRPIRLGLWSRNAKTQLGQTSGVFAPHERRDEAWSWKSAV